MPEWALFLVVDAWVAPDRPLLDANSTVIRAFAQVDMSARRRAIVLACKADM
jgi:hypothetical protein